MNYVLVSVYDTVSGMYAQPQIAVNADVAKRSFFQAVNASVPEKDRGDYELIYLGTFGVDTGTFSLVDHQLLARGGQDA